MPNRFGPQNPRGGTTNKYFTNTNAIKVNDTPLPPEQPKKEIQTTNDSVPTQNKEENKTLIASNNSAENILNEK